MGAGQENFGNVLNDALSWKQDEDKNRTFALIENFFLDDSFLTVS